MLEVTDLATVTTKLYEGMFLVDTAVAAADWDGMIGSIEAVLKRVDAEVVSLRKWDERRLAYDVDKVSRGTYILVYFKCDGEKIREIEKTVQLSEKILRVLILNAEHMTQEDIEKDTPAIKAEKLQEDREAAAEAKVAVEKVAEAESADQDEDDAPAAEVESADAAPAPAEQEEAVAVESAEVTSAGDETAAEVGTEAEDDESKAAE